MSIAVRIVSAAGACAQWHPTSSGADAECGGHRAGYPSSRLTA